MSAVSDQDFNLHLNPTRLRMPLLSLLEV